MALRLLKFLKEATLSIIMKELRVLWKFLASKVVEKENQKNPEEMQNQERPKEGRASGRQTEKHMEVVFACQIIKELRNNFYNKNVNKQ